MQQSSGVTREIRQKNQTDLGWRSVKRSDTDGSYSKHSFDHSHKSSTASAGIDLETRHRELDRIFQDLQRLRPVRTQSLSMKTNLMKINGNQ